MPVSTRHQWAARAAGQPPAPLIEYEVLDPNHEPDLNGELAGGKVYRKSGKEYVRLTADQARFYLDSGSIQEVQKEEAPPEAEPQQQADK
jgi:hypothetical protein